MFTSYDFKEITDTLIKSAETHYFNLKDLPDYNDSQSIRHHDKFHKMFTSLDAKLTSCLYWFELMDNDSCSRIISELNHNRAILRNNSRVVPVMNNNINSNVLYVGIRRGGWTQKWKLSNISGRIIQHFGYYHVGSTQGLQLAHWARNIDSDIKFNVIQFEESFPNAYLAAFEKIMAHKLMPLCGKH